MKWVVFYGFSAIVALAFSFTWILRATDTDLRIASVIFGAVALVFAWRGGMAAQTPPPDEPPSVTPPLRDRLRAGTISEAEAVRELEAIPGFNEAIAEARSEGEGESR